MTFQGARPSCRAFVYVVTAGPFDLASETADTADFAKFTVRAEALAVRAFADQSSKSFVLSRINHARIRALAVIVPPEFVLLRIIRRGGRQTDRIRRVRPPQPFS
jgi:hypothetical protein